MLSTSTRALTTDELAKLKRRIRFSPDDVAWMLLPFGGLAAIGFGLGKLLVWFLSKIGFQTGSLLTFSCMGLMGCLGLVGSIFMFRGATRYRAGQRAEIRNNVVEVIDVKEATAARIGSDEDECPIIIFDAGGGKLLCLLGQWMFDPALFEPRGAEQEFPSDAFRVIRLPTSGDVLGVQVMGNPLGELQETTLSDVGLTSKRLDDFAECAIFDGTLHRSSIAVPRATRPSA